MTRRERHLRIIAYMSERQLSFALQRLLGGDDRFDKFTDEAIEELAAMLVRGMRRERRFAAESRRRYAASQGEAA